MRVVIIEGVKNSNLNHHAAALMAHTLADEGDINKIDLSKKISNNEIEAINKADILIILAQSEFVELLDMASISKVGKRIAIISNDKALIDITRKALLNKGFITVKSLLTNEGKCLKLYNKISRLCKRLEANNKIISYLKIKLVQIKVIKKTNNSVEAIC